MSRQSTFVEFLVKELVVLGVFGLLCAVSGSAGLLDLVSSVVK